MITQIPKTEKRSLARLKYHYEVETKLASQLRNATKDERRHLYSSLYNQLFECVPDHPQLTRKATSDSRLKVVRQQVKFLTRFLNSESIFLEVGAGDCALSIEMAKLVKKVYAIDVSDEITQNLAKPANFELVISDGCSIPVQAGSVDVIYSNQLMEHLHPDDAYDQLRDIYKALVPGGIYICFTPHRFSGPHDISGYFNETALGFHLREYTNAELGSMFREVGFSSIKGFLGAKGTFVSVPLLLSLWTETLLTGLTYSQRQTLSSWGLVRLMLGIRLLALK